MREIFIWRESYYVNKNEFKIIKSSSLFKLKIKLIRLVISKLKKVNLSSFFKLEIIIISEFKIIKSLNSLELKVELIRLIMSKFKRVDSLKFFELELRLIRRIIIESVKSSISIQKVVLIYNKSSVRKET